MYLSFTVFPTLMIPSRCRALSSSRSCWATCFCRSMKRTCVGNLFAARFSSVSRLMVSSTSIIYQYGKKSSSGISSRDWRQRWYSTTWKQAAAKFFMSPMVRPECVVMKSSSPNAACSEKRRYSSFPVQRSDDVILKFISSLFIALKFL